MRMFVRPRCGLAAFSHSPPRIRIRRVLTRLGPGPGPRYAPRLRMAPVSSGMCIASACAWRALRRWSVPSRKPRITLILTGAGDKSGDGQRSLIPSLSPVSAAMPPKPKRTCRRIIGSSDEDIPVISSRDWAENLAQNPTGRVRHRLCSPVSSALITLLRRRSTM